MTDGWDIQSAISLYNIDRWSSGYFSINQQGHIQVLPMQAGAGIDIMDVIAEARDRGLIFPLLIRFQDLLRHRVERINQAFGEAIREANYQNVYRGVFPIKVNQLREVVEEIIDAGKPYHFGLEAGSKPELMAALAIHSDPESLIVCNGYKDNLFIQNALLGRKLGKKIIMVVEKLEELAAILQVSREVGVEPLIGLRVRLQSKGAGKWATSGGENAKFGLSTADLVAASETLKNEGLAHCLQLVHFHVGVAGAGHRHHQARRPRGGAVLREARQDGASARLSGRRRRPRRGLRRVAHGVRQLHQLLAQRVRAGHRL